MKNLFLFCLLILLNANAWGQSTEKLSPEQMVEDFDYLYDRIQKVSPHFEIRRLATGVDVLADIRQLRQYIDTIPSEGDFYEILNKAMRLCKDMHTSFTEGYPYAGIDTTILKRAGEKIRFLQKYEKYDPRHNPFQLYYLDGKYWVPDIYSPDGTVLIPARSQILTINGIPVDEYMNQWILPVSRRVLWDKEHRKYYATNLFSPQRTGNSDTFQVKYQNGTIIKEVNLPSYRIQFPKAQNNSESIVDYFQEDELLYIRIPSMETGKIDFYTNEIKKHHRKTLRKVVLDVRGNGGGNDQVWMDVLAAIIKDPIYSSQKIAFKKNELVIQCFEKTGLEIKEDETLVIGKDTLFCLSDTRDIEPADSSLRYAGNIYILVDNRCFSSTLALIALAQHVDQLVTVGPPIGYFGGEGITPFYFILPHSELCFRVSCSLDASQIDNKKNYESYFQNKIKVPFHPTLEEIFAQREYEGKFYGRNLYQLDSLFRKVLELP